MPLPAKEAAIAARRGETGCEHERDKDGEEETRDKIFLDAGMSKVRHPDRRLNCIIIDLTTSYQS